MAGLGGDTADEIGEDSGFTGERGFGDFGFAINSDLFALGEGKREGVGVEDGAVLILQGQLQGNGAFGFPVLDRDLTIFEFVDFDFFPEPHLLFGSDFDATRLLLRDGGSGSGQVAGNGDGEVGIGGGSDREFALETLFEGEFDGGKIRERGTFLDGNRE